CIDKQISTEREKQTAPRVVRAETARSSSSSWSHITGHGTLPPDVVDGAVSRLGWVALFYAIAFPILRVTGIGNRPWEYILRAPYVLVDVALIGAVLCGGIVC